MTTNPTLESMVDNPSIFKVLAASTLWRLSHSLLCWGDLGFGWCPDSVFNFSNRSSLVIKTDLPLLLDDKKRSVGYRFLQAFPLLKLYNAA